MTDADTIANAGELWKLVHLVQENIGKDGEPLTANYAKHLAAIRALADECDPENGKY